VKRPRPEAEVTGRPELVLREDDVEALADVLAAVLVDTLDDGKHDAEAMKPRHR
jgi:hypothetical protein